MGILNLKWYHWGLILAITANGLTSGSGGGPAYAVGTFVGATAVVAGIRYAWPSRNNGDDSETEQAA